MAELAKDLDFDFDGGMFQNLHGLYPIEEATEIYLIWEKNFMFYATVSEVFQIRIGTE
jgi:hypothetical protein